MVLSIKWFKFKTQKLLAAYSSIPVFCYRYVHYLDTDFLFIITINNILLIQLQQLNDSFMTESFGNVLSKVQKA